MARSKKFKRNDNNLAIAYYRFSSHSQNEASIDRLGRDKYVLAMAKKEIRDAGCEIHLLAENIPTEGPEGILVEGLMDAMAEYYSRQLSQNIQRGMDYNAQHALFNGHKVWGYGVDRETKKYVVDEDTAPFVQRMFAEYAAGKAMQEICDEFNAQGLRTTRGAKFGVKTMNKMLQNRAYIGEYHHGDIVVPDGIPALVDKATFDAVQARFALNKRKGSQRARGKDNKDGEAPRYWLTGKLFCGKCGASMQGVHGTSKTGRKYYYYYCKAQRAKQCDKRKMRKEQVEELVTILLRGLLENPENLASLAVDAAAYYRDNYRNTHYLDGLEAKRREVEKSTANLLKVIEKGVLSDAVTDRLVQLEEQKAALDEAIKAEHVRAALFEDEHSIKAYFDKFMRADFDNPQTRDAVMEYFVDKVYLYDDKLVATFFYSEDRTEISWGELGDLVIDPFVKGEAAEFDVFPFGSTKDNQRPYLKGVLIYRDVFLMYNK